MTIRTLQWSDEWRSQSGESAQGESHLTDELCKVISKAQLLYIKYKRDAKGVQRNITAWITTDSIKIFSFTFCTLFTVYCTCKIAKDAFRIVLYFKTFYMLHCAVARFVLKQWFVYDCTYFVAEMYNVVCYWKTVSLYCELKCSLKTSVSLVLATEHLKL